MTTEAGMGVQLVCAWPDRYWRTQLRLVQGATAADALAAATAELGAAGIDPAGLSLAVFGRGVEAWTVLRDGDRLELLRPLLLSPQQARVARAKAARGGVRK